MQLLPSKTYRAYIFFAIFGLLHVREFPHEYCVEFDAGFLGQKGLWGIIAPGL